ncbi:MAG: hypothetical protein MSK40_10365 [Parabacteroides sp.]|nr:hypothetical protein [Parabacteroides sp.]MDY4726622.1 hypothetical protein [Candidatus Cryptobacteroides sp.]
MTLWQKLDMSERIAAVQTTAASKNIEDRSVEKDWWVTAVLKALFTTSCSDYLLLKAERPSARDGQSLSVFSEDIESAIYIFSNKVNTY